MNPRWRVVGALAPLLRICPPWWRLRLYARIAGHPMRQGDFAGLVERRVVKPHGFRMNLFLDDWLERMAYYLGIYYEIEITKTIQCLVRQGDVFLDVGANVGFVTLLASQCVGDASGRVIACEPNPELVKRLEHVLQDNQIKNVEVVETALGAAEGQGVLQIPSHHGQGTLREADSFADSASRVGVRVASADAVVGKLDQSRYCVVKIDVEGYEQQVLDGMQYLRCRAGTAFLVEVTDKWLRALGGSAGALFTQMHTDGYTAFQPVIRASGRFELQPVPGPLPNNQYDVVFLKPEDGWHGRAR